MELRHLRYFVAVAEELHFGRAAEGLRIAQPALSRQIQRLEQELGVQLLRRSSRSVRLTKAGRAFLDEARVSLNHSERAIQEARRAASGEAVSVRIGLVGGATFGVLAGIVGPFRNRFPGVRLAPREMNTVPQVEALGSGRLDVGFLHLPADHGLEDLEVETFAEEPLVAALPASHPVADARRVRLDAMSGEPFVLIDRAQEPGWNEQLRDVWAAAGFVPQVVAEPTELSVTLGLVAAGVGVTLLPASVRNLRIAGVAYRGLAGPVLNVRLSVARSRASPSPATRALVESAREFARR